MRSPQSRESPETAKCQLLPLAATAAFAADFFVTCAAAVSAKSKTQVRASALRAMTRAERFGFNSKLPSEEAETSRQPKPGLRPQALKESRSFPPGCALRGQLL